MASRPRRAKVALLLVALALVAVAIPLAEPVWEWVMTERVGGPAEGHDFIAGATPLTGWHRVGRWGTREVLHGTSVSFYASNGYKFMESVHRDARCVRCTCWSDSGAVVWQSGEELGSRMTLDRPPWLWGATDQTSPSDPQWIAEHGK